MRILYRMTILLIDEIKYKIRELRDNIKDFTDMIDEYWERRSK